MIFEHLFLRPIFKLGWRQEARCKSNILSRSYPENSLLLQNSARLPAKCLAWGKTFPFQIQVVYQYFIPKFPISFFRGYIRVHWHRLNSYNLTRNANEHQFIYYSNILCDLPYVVNWRLSKVCVNVAAKHQAVYVCSQASDIWRDRRTHFRVGLRPRCHQKEKRSRKNSTMTFLEKSGQERKPWSLSVSNPAMNIFSFKTYCMTNIRK